MTNQEAITISKGNQDAATFIISFVALCHTLDDIEDKDKPVDDERIIRSLLAFLSDAMFNPFFLANKEKLYSLIASGFNAWLDSNDMSQHSDEKIRRASDVVKGLYHEVVFFCALLCGGWDHYRAITKTHREYDYDQVKEGA